VALAAGGIVLLADPFGAGGIDRTGLVLILAAAACWAVYIVLAQRATRVFSGSTGLALAAAVAWVVPLGPGVAEGGAALLSPGPPAVGAAVALLSSVIPYSLEIEALRRMPAHIFGVLMSLEPAAAALAGLVILGQVLRANEWLGMALVIVASAGATRYATRATAPRDA
jgi:inner membrane transporter RhtA